MFSMFGELYIYIYTSIFILAEVQSALKFELILCASEKDIKSSERAYIGNFAILSMNIGFKMSRT
jgi:hypothetical protein